MLKRFVIAAACALIAAPLAAQDGDNEIVIADLRKETPPTFHEQFPPPDMDSSLSEVPALDGTAPAPSLVVIETSLGNITLELDGEHAPVTAANFLQYADEDRFNGTVFYRSMVMPPLAGEPFGLIQGGTQGHPDRILPGIAHETTTQTGIKHKRGTISMARFEPGSATGDFLILISDMEGLDDDPTLDDPYWGPGFAAFGHVVDGMDVVMAIYESPRDPEKGEGAMKGEMLEPPVEIIDVRRASSGG